MVTVNLSCTYVPTTTVTNHFRYRSPQVYFVFVFPVRVRLEFPPHNIHQVRCPDDDSFLFLLNVLAILILFGRLPISFQCVCSIAQSEAQSHAVSSTHLSNLNKLLHLQFPLSPSSSSSQIFSAWQLFGIFVPLSIRTAGTSSSLTAIFSP